MKRLLFAMIMVAATCAAHAQAIYRCGQTYSQKPCPEGKIIESSDPRTAAQRAEAKRVTAREKQLAEKLESDRRAQESAQSRPLAASLAPAAKPPVQSVGASAPADHKRKIKARAHRRKAASAADFTAVVPPIKPGQK